MKIRRILLPTDFSTSANIALEHAIFHAEIHQAELHILHNYTWDYGQEQKTMPDLNAIVEKMEKAFQVILKNALDPHKDVPLKIMEKGTTRSSSAEAALDYTRNNDIDLIVMGTHGRKGFHHFLVGSTAEMVARLAPCPVITVRAGGSSSELDAIRTILVPVDLSEESAAALIRARELANFHHANLLIYHAADDDAVDNANNDNAEDAVARFAAQTAGPKVRQEIILDNKSAARGICQTAETRAADMIVMGTHGRTGLRKAMLGSVAVQVVRLAPCPVLTLKKSMVTDAIAL